MTFLTEQLRKLKQRREERRPARLEKARRRAEANAVRLEHKRNAHLGGGGGV